MTGRRAFALGGLALAIVGAVGAILVRLATQAPFLPITFGFGPVAMVAFIIMGLSWASIGAFLVIRRPQNVVGLLMVLAGAGYALSMLGLAVTFAVAADGTAGWPAPGRARGLGDRPVHEHRRRRVLHRLHLPDGSGAIAALGNADPALVAIPARVRARASPSSPAPCTSSRPCRTRSASAPISEPVSRSPRSSWSFRC